MTAHEPVQQQSDSLDLGAQTDLWRAQARLARIQADVLVVARVLTLLLVLLAGGGIGYLLLLYVRFLMQL